MSEEPRNGAEAMSLTSKVQQKTAPRPAYENQRWLYGYHFKTRHVRMLAERYGLPWEKDPVSCMFNVQHLILRACSDLDFGWKYILYKGDAATIISFVEDDGRKRLENNRFSKKDMQRVRRVLGLPRGTWPKWYNYADRYSDDSAEFSSDDERFPEVDLFGRESTDEDLLWDEDEEGDETSVNVEGPKSMDDTSEESGEDKDGNCVGN